MRFTPAPSSVRRYSGTRLNARRRSSGRRLQNSEQSIGVNIHLCAFTTSESARSTPANAQRSSGHTIALPAYAASTCSQAPARAHASAIAGTGSTEVVEVVPTVATTAHAPDRSSVSTRIRNAASTGSLRTSSPAMRQAFSTEECACSEHTTTRRPGAASRAATSAAKVEVEAVSSMCPCQPSGRPSSCATQSTTCSSSSVSAGDVRHRNPTLLSVAAISSARMPGSSAVLAK